MLLLLLDLNHSCWNGALGETKQRVQHLQVHQNVQHLGEEST